MDLSLFLHALADKGTDEISITKELAVDKVQKAIDRKDNINVELSLSTVLLFVCKGYQYKGQQDKHDQHDQQQFEERKFAALSFLFDEVQSNRWIGDFMIDVAETILSPIDLIRTTDVPFISQVRIREPVSSY
jgi:hypothetical protein